MKIESYKCFNAHAQGKINPARFVKEEFKKANSVFRILYKLRPEIMKEYLLCFKERLNEVGGNYRIDPDSITKNDTAQHLVHMQDDPELQALVMGFIGKNLEIRNFHDQNEATIFYFNQYKASYRLSYHRVKALEDLLGKEQAIQTYKDVVTHLILEMKKETKEKQPRDPRTVTRSKSRNKYLESCCKQGTGDFTIAIFDDYKEIYRFDRCVAHEVLKDFNDPDIAHLSSCYRHENPEWNNDEIIHLRRTQTLHHDKFCDEFYWNNAIHPNAEQPTLELTKNL